MAQPMTAQPMTAQPMTALPVTDAPNDSRGGGGYVIICPYCNSRASIRMSRQETPLIRELYLLCRNVDCGHGWKEQMSFVHTISPSGIDRPDLDLPKCPAEYARRVFPEGARRRRADSGPDDDEPSLF